MGDIQKIFTRFAPEYLDRYQDRMPKNHIKALKAITTCRTAACCSMIVADAGKSSSAFVPAATAIARYARTIKRRGGSNTNWTGNCRDTTS